MSHPIRVRGLKPVDIYKNVNAEDVASYTGAWIETVRLPETPSAAVSHPIRVRGLKQEKGKRADT